jgi:hypothetical protein
MNLQRTTLGLGWLAIVLMAACSSDSEPANPADSGGSGGSDGGTTDGGAGSDAATSDGAEAGPSAAVVARGKYLVNNVAACPECHTPRLMTGALDKSKFLAGSTVPFADIVPGDEAGVGNVYVRNITQDMMTGIGSWTDAEIKKAFLDGVDKDGKALFPIMPYFVFHNMKAADADAIVAYLRTIPPVANDIPENGSIATGVTMNGAAMPIPVSALPKTTLAATDPNYQHAMDGMYLAANIGICMECHTERVMGPVPLDTMKLFAGNEVFPLGPPFGDVHSANITPAGIIMGWTAEQVKTLLKTGLDDKMMPICPPMPAGPMQAFGGLTDQDALNIGYYITTLPPIDNGMIPHCSLPTPPGDGGMTDGGMGDGATEASTGDGATE